MAATPPWPPTSVSSSRDSKLYEAAVWNAPFDPAPAQLFGRLWGPISTRQWRQPVTADGANLRLLERSCNARSEVGDATRYLTVL
ncbi:hypothetical protein GQ55_6G157600 [Panicum hallii var. hallii]|uniref:Uncharacterized protein n=1 Tax=Panicum hallii var. hallii TaxID=1504633 RepID=A0A2T7D6F6_9POAL|nr:hypothetical protein GQ55_6G157600 [Panicum hallii var. hallii]